MSEAGGDKWELIYWPGFPGRGEFVRLLFEEAGVPYTDLLLEGKWTSDDLMSYVFKGGNKLYPVFAPPIIRKGDFQLQQTPAILQYLGKKFGLYPKNEVDEAHAMQVALTAAEIVMDCQTAYHPVKPYGSSDEQREEAKPFIAEFRDNRLPRYFKYFESLLAANSAGSGFFIGSEITFCDLAVFHVLSAADAQFNEWWTANSPSWPKLVALKKAIAERPRIAAFLSSKRHQPYSGDAFM